MKLKINGKIKEYPKDVTIFDILKDEDILEPVAVELFLNGKKVEFENYEKIKLNDGDELEFIYLFASG